MSNKGIYSLTPFTLLDYPDKTACIIWFAGCNMRCLYCYNPDIVLGKGKLDFEIILDFLKSRIGLLDGVVLSGGECTIHKNIIDFIKQIKMLGFKVKVDTNGSMPNVLKKLVDYKLVDYIALDFKCLPHSFEFITESDLFLKFEESLSILMACSVPFEIRTTMHADVINQTEFQKMVEYLQNKKFKGNYYVQYFKNNVPTIGHLDCSNKKIKYENLSTPNVRVVVRE